MNKEDVSVKEQHTLYKEIHPPTGISHCCQAFFTHVASKEGRSLVPNLIVARATLLQIYKARTSTVDEEACWLELVAEYRVAGNIQSLAVLQSRAPGNQRDAVLLTFRDAKLAVLDWDELSNAIVSSSLHSWEGDNSLRGGHTVFPHGPQALTDPQGRCAAVLMFHHQLALLPSTGADSLEAVVDAGGLSQASTLGRSYTVNLAKLGVKEVRDAAFLHRYNEPVLLALHETSPTWAGLYTERKDTMCLTAFSLNLAHQKHLRLWHAADLPSDAHKLLPVPLGGAIVLCQSLILYHSQGVSCTLAVNSKAYAGVPPPYMDLNPMREAPSATVARHANKFATNVEPEAAAAAASGAPRAEGFELDMQDAVGVWLTPSTLLLALASGQIVLLSLEVTAGSVSRLKLQKANDAPRPSCGCRLGQYWVFLGSWVGDSLLLHAAAGGHKKKVAQIEGPKVATLALPAPEHAKADPFAEAPQENGDKHPESSEFNLKVGGEGGPGDEEDFAAVEKESSSTSLQPNAKRQRLEVEAPKLGDKEEEEDDEFASIFQSIETARISTIATGFTKFTFKVVDSLLGVGPIRCMVMGEVVSSAPPQWGSTTQKQARQLVACTGQGRSGALAVLRQSILPEEITEVPLPGVRGLWAVRFRPEGLPWEPDFAWHAFLLLTVGRGTKVLQTGEELSEMQAGQVDFVLDKPTLLAANLLSWARTIQVCPDKVVLLAGSSKQAETSVQELVAPPEAPTGVQSEKAAIAALPRSLAGVEILAAAAADPYVLLHLSNGSAALLQGNLETGRLEVVQQARSVLHEVPASDPSAHITSCNLYKDYSGWLAHSCGLTADVFCIICNASGLLQIFALPSMELVFDHAKVTEGMPTLSGDPEAEATLPQDPAEEGNQADVESEFFSARPVVVEVKMESFATSSEAIEAEEEPRSSNVERMPCQCPVLVLLLSDGGMLAYAAFSSPVGLRFSRLYVDWIGHSDGRGAHGISSRMTRFDGLGEGSLTYSGIFIAGDRPLWLVAARGTLIPHPMDANASVTSMTPFNNINCPQGFITASLQGNAGALSVAQLPMQVRLDTPWPLQKIPLKATPHTLAFMPEHGVYALLISKPAKYQKRLPEEEGGDTQATYAYVAAESAAKERGTEEIAQVRLVRPGSWTTAWRYDLMPAETALCVRSLTVHNTATGQQQVLLAVGTAQSYGEDYPCTGRLLFFELSRAEAESETQQLDAWEGKLLYVREYQGPVTALAAIEGSVLVAWGSRLDTHRWNGSRLETTGFHDASVMLTSLSIIKRFVAYGDVHKGITFLQITPDNRAFNNLSKDFDNCDVVATDFVINGPKLFVLVADAASNLRLFTYQPDHPETWAGKRILPVGAIHTGHAAADLVAVKLQPPGVKTPPRGALTGCLDGSIACMAPVWLQGMVPPLRALQRLLELKIPQPAGLNPCSHRERFRRTPKAMGGGQHWGKPISSRTIVDGDLLWQYQFLPHSQQASLAYKLGFDKNQLLALLDSLAVALSVL